MATGANLRRKMRSDWISPYVMFSGRVARPVFDTKLSGHVRLRVIDLLRCRVVESEKPERVARKEVWMLTLQTEVNASDIDKLFFVQQAMGWCVGSVFGGEGKSGFLTKRLANGINECLTQICSSRELKRLRKTTRKGQ